MCTQRRQICLRTHLRSLLILGCLQSVLRSLWSDCADAHAELSLRWAAMQYSRKCCASTLLTSLWGTWKFQNMFRCPGIISCCRIMKKTKGPYETVCIRMKNCTCTFHMQSMPSWRGQVAVYWSSTWEKGIYHIGDQQRLRRACA